MTETTAELVLDEQFMADPHALYAVLREQRPVVRSVTPQGLHVWLVTRYDDVRAALTDARLSKDGAAFGRVLERHSVAPERRLAFAEALTAHMLNSDPPDHTRLRKLVGKAFTVRAIARLRPRIEQIAAALADDMQAGPGEVDLLDAFAFPLPMTVICELLGVPDGERESFRGWSNTLLSAAHPEQRQAAAMAMAEYLIRLVEDKRAHPGEDMLSAIVEASEDSDRLSATETVSMAFLLLVAGHETTVNLIGNGMLALLRRPDQLAALRAEPELTASAVEEFLRFDGPVNLATFRHTTEPVTIAGTEIPAGEVVLVSLASANRDPAHYARADELDLRRDAGNLAFGFGIHHCLGAPLARLEGEIAFRTLLARFPELALAAEPEELSWRSSTLIRGLTRLPVSLGNPAVTA
ncbi:cytochrome P450 family protein [Pseudonocardia acidicola]|uniref:Cytochrome P450 n=1 Tax=Pseudonocardia acidicola TaxID=2724939 RepID=A0ABX1SI42_9PSEU|nr:cytochrome P450 [Pseudonocardia acidicola]NMI00067.1 cytochrome P450 [Pseudonocardia acidicola]